MADVRELPFRDESFDAIYSMGTIEHFDETEHAVEETAILFIPGWLRMLDLACHAWCRPLARVTGALVWPFAFLDRHLPAVRKHGYLLATVALKPERASQSRPDSIRTTSTNRTRPRPPLG